MNEFKWNFLAKIMIVFFGICIMAFFISPIIAATFLFVISVVGIGVSILILLNIKWSKQEGKGDVE